MILFEKFGQHHPLNRQSERYAQEGIDLSVSTLADQVGRDYQEFRARGRFSSLADEPFAEDDGELGLGLEPLARRPFPFVSRVVQNQV